MKQVVSISLGSSQRDHAVTATICGQTVRIRRMGVDGDFRRARELFLKLDGTVDAFGMGGCEFGINFDGRVYPLRAVTPLVQGLRTPVVDGSGVRAVVESGLGQFVLENLADSLAAQRVLFCVSAARYDMVEGFYRAGFELKFGDPGFVLGLPIASRSFWLARTAGRIFIPVVVRAPFSWLYPTGKKQHVNRPRFRSWFAWASVIADDFHYIKRHMPESLDGKIIVTNTTTAGDRELLQQRGARWLVTSTPMFDGRSFGTNVFEAALTAALNSSVSLTHGQIREALDGMGYQPTITRLN